MTQINALIDIVGPSHVLTGRDCEKYSSDWFKLHPFTPLAVVRPANVHQVSKIVKWANLEKIAVVPMGGNTGLADGTFAEAALVLSLERMNAIREIRSDARLAVVEAGVILSDLHEAAEEHDFIFPMTFGARGSAMIGGMLSTNAGGSNVLRYGNTRDLCLGIEVVLPNGEIMEMMSELHKDNSGYNLKHLMIGAEGTLGIITAAVLRLMPQPRAYATAMLGVPSLDAALSILNALQSATGGSVEAYEYMPRFYIEKYAAHFADRQLPFPIQYDVNILVEVATTAEDLSAADDTGQIRLSARFEEILADQLQSGAILDAVVAQNDTQRAQMWHLRESAAEVTVAQKPLVNHDIAVPLDKVAVFLDRMQDRLAALDPGAETIVVSHLGDGNIHYPVWPKSHDPKVHAAITEAVEDVVLDLGGSFSAEHGIGRSKLPSMARRKNPVAVAVMRQIKQALDPNNILNPGKVIPPQTTKGS